MNQDHATMIVGHLVAATTGWNDEAVVAYVAEIERLDHVDAAGEAAQQLIRSWTETRRPPIAVLLNHYRQVLARRESSRALERGRPRVVPLREGIEIARAAYEQECRLHGRTPDPGKFDRWLAAATRAEQS